MNQIIFNVGIAAIVGVVKSAAGYIAVIKREEFDAWKFMQGILIGVVGGGIAGAMANDWKMSIIGALAADDIRSAAVNYVKK